MPQIPVEEVRKAIQRLAHNARIFKAWKETLSRDKGRESEELTWLNANFEASLHAAERLAAYLPPRDRRRPPQDPPPEDPPPQPQPAPVPPPSGPQIVKVEATVTGLEYDGAHPGHPAIVVQIPSDIEPIIIQAPKH